jgi:hypothetical protein
VIFIDRSIPKSVAQALQAVRGDVEWFEPRYPSWTKDTEWLPEAGASRWIVILRDKRIRTRPGERQAIIDGGAGCFIINQGTDPSKWEYLKLLALTLDEMIDTDSRTTRPYIFTVSRDGDMKQVLK